MHAAIMCGHGTDYTGAGIAIPLGHALSARFHLDNGITNAIVLPHVLRFNAGYAKSGLGKIALALGEMPAGAEVNVEHLNARLRAVFDSLGVPTRLRDVGVTKESLTDIASISMGDWFVRDNPRSVHAASELENILQEAW
jgi:alcohol dehydrogenase class IV